MTTYLAHIEQAGRRMRIALVSAVVAATLLTAGCGSGSHHAQSPSRQPQAPAPLSSPSLPTPPPLP